MPSKNKNWILIDGSNFYHGLKLLPYKYKPSGFNYLKFAQYLTKNSSNAKTKYYIGAIREEENNPKSKELMRQQQKFLSKIEKQGFEINLGYMLKTNGYHEKGVDVKIAVDIVKGALKDEYNTLYLLSSDTDLIPAVKESIKVDKEIVYVGFAKRPSYALIKNCSESLLLNLETLKNFFE